MTLADIVSLFEVQGAEAQVRQPKVLVVGDAIIDKYCFGRVDRLCPEAPVPVFTTIVEQERPGGAANVTAQLDALNVHVALWSGERWQQSVKTRFMVGQHMVMRLDHDATALDGPKKHNYEDLRHCLQQKPDVIIISDYGKGWVTPQAIAMCMDSNIDVLVDPKGGAFERYAGAYLITPNEKEAAWFATADPERANAIFPNVLFKQGHKGMTLHQAVGPSIAIPASAKHVYDVTGAGDTVIATVAAAIAVGAGLEDACRLAALAAGYVVGEVGTAICPLPKLKELADVV